MENKLDVLTKKLYEEGVDKANQEAEKIIAQAKEKAAKLIAEAEEQAKGIKAGAATEVENMKKKAESEMTLSARQAITALKQSITSLISGEVAGNIAKAGFKDEAFVQEMIVAILKKWDVASGNLNLELLLSEEEKEKFQQFVATKYKELLDKGLEIKVGDHTDAFVIQPKGRRISGCFFREVVRDFLQSVYEKLYQELAL